MVVFKNMRLDLRGEGVIKKNWKPFMWYIKTMAHSFILWKFHPLTKIGSYGDQFSNSAANYATTRFDLIWRLDRRLNSSWAFDWWGRFLNTDYDLTFSRWGSANELFSCDTFLKCLGLYITKHSFTYFFLFLLFYTVESVLILKFFHCFSLKIF